jgi:hypothetical protein
VVDGHTFLLWFHIGAMMIAFGALPIAGIIFRVIVVHVDEQRVFQLLATAFSRIFAAGGVSVGIDTVFRVKRNSRQKGCPSEECRRREPTAYA